EAPPPEGVAEDRNLGPVESALVGSEVPAERERHTEHLEEIAGHAHRTDSLRLSPSGQRLSSSEIEEREVRGQRLEARVLLAPRVERVDTGSARRQAAPALVFNPGEP